MRGPATIVCTFLLSCSARLPISGSVEHRFDDTSRYQACAPSASEVATHPDLVASGTLNGKVYRTFANRTDATSLLVVVCDSDGNAARVEIAGAPATPPLDSALLLVGGFADTRRRSVAILTVDDSALHMVTYSGRLPAGSIVPLGARTFKVVRLGATHIYCINDDAISRCDGVEKW
jgi:hypothetical protein